MTETLCSVCQSPLLLGQDPCPYCGAALDLGPTAPARTLTVGHKLHQGKFAVGRVLGEGNFGITYKGAHRDLQRPVAIKELFPLDLRAMRLGTRVSVPATQTRAFRRAQDQALQEARIIADLRSRHIVDVHDMFLENGTAYIVMEYLEGETLEARLQRAGRLSPDEVQWLARALGEALAEVHAGGWLHRDVKPANIVLTADRRAVLIDFGSARAFHTHRTQRHTQILTPKYAAPEQYSEAARFGPQTDVFSLGATLYHALTGAPPPSAMDRLQGEYTTPDLPIKTPLGLATALRQALELRVNDRPPSIAMFLALLQEADPTVEAEVSGFPIGSAASAANPKANSAGDIDAVEDAKERIVATDTLETDSAADRHLMDELEWTEHYDIASVKANTVVQGIVLQKRPRSLELDIGARFEGEIDGREIERLGESYREIEVGQSIEVFVFRTDDSGQPRVSIIRARQEKDWLRAEELLASKAIVASDVIDYNRGGVLVAMGLIRGFIPAHHLSQESQMAQDRSADPADRFQPLIGRTLQVKVIDIERRRNRLIFSEKEAVRELRNQRKDAILEELEVGEVRDGVVSSLTDFGAFVNIDGADGLIHVSELSWSRVNHPSEVLTVGQQVQIKVISVEKERKRIGLSLRQLQPRPWDTLAERYKEGDLVRAVITRIKDFGAFARLAGEPVEGLIHISEMSRERVERADQVVTVGEEYEVKVIRLDTQRRRMGLSIKQADLDWTPEADELSATATMPASASAMQVPLPEMDNAPA